MDKKKMKNLTAIAIGVSAWATSNIPPAVLLGIGVVAILIGLDQVTGWLAAWAKNDFSSEASRKRGAIKLLTYVAVLSAVCGIAYLTKHWWLAGPPILWVQGTELGSIRENLKKQKAAGVKLGVLTPLDRLFDGIEAVFAKMFPAMEEDKKEDE